MFESDAQKYNTAVKNLRDTARNLPDEGTARTVYKECRLMELKLRQEIKKRKAKNGAVEITGILELQEQTTTEIIDYAEEQEWDLSPVDEDVERLKNGRQK